MGKRGRKLPTLTFDDLRKVIESEGWVRVDGAKHEAYKHPKKSGKIILDKKWTSVPPGSWIHKNVLEQAGLTASQFEDIYWKKVR
jgi:predicted RNA binding protein YcfA (HicA-like mRNA interferase family)